MSFWNELRTYLTILINLTADKDAKKGKPAERKTTRAGGSGADLAKIAQQQQEKLVKVREELVEQKAAKVKEAVEAAEPPPVEAVPGKSQGCDGRSSETKQ